MPFPLGALEYEGGMSSAGFLRKKFLGLSSTVMGSAGMIGKSSGAGKCVKPNVCQRTTSLLAMDAVGFAAIQAGRPADGSPLVWGTWRPAGWIWESSSEVCVSFCSLKIRSHGW